MQIESDSPSSNNVSIVRIIILAIILSIIIEIAVGFVKNQIMEAAAGKDIIRCIIDENASDLSSPACQRVISRCKNDKTDSCEKLIFYSDDGIHSEEALSILGNICSKGGEQACDILINRCIENSSNCEILGKPYGIKSYLAMKADDKNIGKSVMYKKIKNYYEKDIDNIVNSVIKTCITNENSMACQIFTSKVYEFSPSEKPYFILGQNSNSRIEFSKTGISLAKYSKTNATEVKKNDEEKSSLKDISDKNDDFSAKSEHSEDKQNFSTEEKTQTDNLKIENNNLGEISENTEASQDVSEKITGSSKESPAIISKPTILKSCLTTGEENNIAYIKNKIYSFEITYKEPATTKIRWLVSFDGRATWKKWNGISWVQAETSSGIENVDFSTIGNNSAEVIKGLTNYTLQSGESSFDFAVELMSPDEILSPYINKIQVKYY